jgi:4-carboxymuconolactone decarboxylase
MEEFRKRADAMRRKVLGDAHVAKAKARTTAFDAPFQAMIEDAAWGHVWAREGEVTLRERSMMTIALLAALGQDDELAMHIRACSRTGASRDDIREALLHVAIYAGVPRANHAIQIARKVFEEDDV